MRGGAGFGAARSGSAHADPLTGVPGRTGRERRSAAHWSLHMPLRHQHRGGGRRARRGGVRQHAAKRGLRRTQSLYVFAGYPGAHLRTDQGTQAESGHRRLLHAAHSRAVVPEHVAPGGPEPAPLPYGQHPRAGFLGAPGHAGDCHSESQRFGENGHRQSP